MSRRFSTIIWIIALCAVLAAAFVLYNKNKPESSLQPTQQTAETGSLSQGTGQTGGTEGNTVQGEGQVTAQSTAQGTAPGTEKGTGQSEKVMAPDFVLKDLDGKSIKLSDYRGKIVILNFWTTWCKYCKQEMPDLNKLAGELGKGKEAVILAVDSQEPASTVKNYLDQNGFTLKVLLDTDGAVSQAYGIPGYPTTFIVNSDGSLYTYISGATESETLKRLIEKAKNGEPFNQQQK